MSQLIAKSDPRLHRDDLQQICLSINVDAFDLMIKIVKVLKEKSAAEGGNVLSSRTGSLISPRSPRSPRLTTFNSARSSQGAKAIKGIRHNLGSPHN